MLAFATNEAPSANFRTRKEVVIINEFLFTLVKTNDYLRFGCHRLPQLKVDFSWFVAHHPKRHFVSQPHHFNFNEKKAVKFEFIYCNEDIFGCWNHKFQYNKGPAFGINYSSNNSSWPYTADLLRWRNWSMYWRFIVDWKADTCIYQRSCKNSKTSYSAVTTGN